VRHQPTPTQTFFRQRINTFFDGKIPLLYHQKAALCCMLIFFHVKMTEPRLDQTQKRCVSEIPFFKIRLKRETNLVLARSANQHQVIMPFDYQKCPRD